MLQMTAIILGALFGVITAAIVWHLLLRVVVWLIEHVPSKDR